jgi:hypothetical protein
MFCFHKTNSEYDINVSAVESIIYSSLFMPQSFIKYDDHKEQQHYDFCFENLRSAPDCN